MLFQQLHDLKTLASQISYLLISAGNYCTTSGPGLVSTAKTEMSDELRKMDIILGSNSFPRIFPHPAVSRVTLPAIKAGRGF